MPFKAMKDFTSTGCFDSPVKEESKKEPSVEFISTVKVPRHEYALLVAAKAKLDMVERMVTGLAEYGLRDMLMMMLELHEAKEEDAE